MARTLFRQAMDWDGRGAIPFLGDLLVDGNRIRAAPGRPAKATLPAARGLRPPASQLRHCRDVWLLNKLAAAGFARFFGTRNPLLNRTDTSRQRQTKWPIG